MLQNYWNGLYLYHMVLGMVFGKVDSGGVYHVLVGHHRMAAALEIHRETGNDVYLRMLLSNGGWENVVDPPIGSCPMPARNWWGWFCNRYGF